MFVRITQENHESDILYCPHCLAKNPIRAYICLTCFKLIHPPIKVPFWKQAFQGTRPVFLMVVLMTLVIIILLNRWMARVETMLVSIQEQNQQYYSSVVSYMNVKFNSQKVNGGRERAPGTKQPEN